MNAVPPLPGESRVPAPGVAARRCVRHAGREAAARCPGCAQFFCRECVSEHGGRWLCAPCLARAAAAAGPRAGRGRSWRRLGGLAAAFAGITLVFFLLGTFLRRIPPDFHEGTVWRNAFEADP